MPDNVDNKLYNFASELLLKDSENNFFPLWEKGINRSNELYSAILKRYIEEISKENQLNKDLLKGQDIHYSIIKRNIDLFEKSDLKTKKNIINKEISDSKSEIKKIVSDTEKYIKYITELFEKAKEILSNEESTILSKTLSAVVCKHANNIIKGKNSQLTICNKQLNELNKVKNNEFYEYSIDRKIKAMKKDLEICEGKSEQLLNKSNNLEKYKIRIEKEIDQLKVDKS